MIDHPILPDISDKESPSGEIDRICRQFNAHWTAGRPPRIEDYLDRDWSSVEKYLQRRLLVKLVMQDLANRWRVVGNVGNPLTLQDSEHGRKSGAERGPRCLLLEDYVQRFPRLGTIHDLSDELVIFEYRIRHSWGDKPEHSEYLARFGRGRPRLSELLLEADARLVGTSGWGDSTADDAHSSDARRSVKPPGNTVADARAAAVPEAIGRYEVRYLLGEGSFGAVYDAWDPRLERRVAIKAPRVSRPDMFIQEARRVAGLDHPHVVPVYDVGDDHMWGPFIVSKLIDGQDLQRVRATGRLSYHESALIIALIATALHHAHERGIVHRDVKPTNILIGSDGTPYLTDFGIAIDEQDRSDDQMLVGSAAYMSPEQASMRSGLVDGRSDIFSLGIIFYELLTGEFPFRGISVSQTLERIRTVPPIPPRQKNDRIPTSFERICLRCLAKPVAERYSTARDLADELMDALTYQPRPIDVSSVALPEGFDDLIEKLAENTHEVWARRRIAEGWQYGPKRDDRLKTHPCLVPYSGLPESEKLYDRDLLLNAIQSLPALGYQISRVEVKPTFPQSC